MLHLDEVFLQVGDILNDLLQDVVGRLSRVVLKSSALRSQQLNFLLVIVQALNGNLVRALQ